MIQRNFVTVSLISDPFANPIKPESVQLQYSHGLSVRDYAIRALECDNFDVVMALNGVPVESNPVMFPGDHLMMCIVPEGGGKNILRTVAMIVVAAAATYFTLGAGAPAWLVNMGGMAQSVAAGTLMAAGGLLVNAVLPYQPVSNLSDDTRKSTNYGWGSSANQAEEGIALPKLFGERLITPPRVGGYRSIPDGSKELGVLRMSFALAEDILDTVTETDIFINNKVLSDYPNAKYAFRNGWLQPTEALRWFPTTIVEQAIGQSFDALNTTEIVQINEADIDSTAWSSVYQFTNEIQHIVFALYFPEGRKIYTCHTENSGWGEPYSVCGYEIDGTFQLVVQYREVGQPVWNDISISLKTSDLPETERTQWTLQDKSKMWAFLPDLTLGIYEVRFKTTTDEYPTTVLEMHAYSSVPSTGYTTTGSSVTDKIIAYFNFPAGLYYVDDEGGFATHTVNLTCQVREHGTTPWTEMKKIKVSNNSSDSFWRVIEFSGLDPNTYDIRAYVEGRLPASSRYQDICTFEFIQEVVSKPFSYPGVAMLCVQIEATEDLYGSWPVVQVNAKRKDYLSGDHPSTNPAWAARALLDQFNIVTGKIDETSFNTWANYCATETLTCGFYVDKQITMGEALVELGKAGNAAVVQYGTRWTVVIDDVAAPVQTFGSDNIVEDSFEEVFMSAENRAKTVIVWFFDQNNFGKKTPIRISTAQADDDPNDIPAEYTLYAVTGEEQAKHLAIRMLNSTRLGVRTVSWMSDVDAINCCFGNVVYLQNDLPVWGVAPGRVVSATSTSVVCDIPIDYSNSFYSGKQMRIFVRHQNPAVGTNVDLIEKLSIANPHLDAPNTAVIQYTASAGTFSKIPEAGSLVLIGWLVDTEESTGAEITSVKKFRVANIELSQDQRAKITAIEYYDDMYVDDYVVSLPTPETGLEIGNLTATSAWQINGRVADDYITLAWTGIARTYYVFYQRWTGAIDTNESNVNNWTTWSLYGTTASASINVFVSAGYKYRFSISKTSSPDLTKMIIIDFHAVDHASIIEGPSDVICIETEDQSWNGLDLNISWTRPSLIFTIKRYRVDIYNASDILIRGYDTFVDKFSYTYAMNCQDRSGTAAAVIKLKVVVVDDMENEASTTMVTFTNPAPSAPTELASSGILGGIVFSWSPSTKQSFSHWTYRTIITGASWSGWITTKTASVTIVLSAAQIESYSDNKEISIQVVEYDVFGQSSTAASRTGETGVLRRQSWYEIQDVPNNIMNLVSDPNFSMSSPWTPPPSGSHFFAIAYSEFLNIAVTISIDGIVITSSDGIYWQRHPNVPAIQWKKIIWIDTLQIFVAASNTHSATPLMSSPDGKTWTVVTTGISYAVRDMVWAENYDGGKIVAVFASHFLVSSDGINWTQKSLPANAIYYMAYSPTLNRFAAFDNINNSMQYSSDLETWTTGISPGITYARAVIWSVALNKFVVANKYNDTTYLKVCYSSDGIDWYSASNFDNNDDLEALAIIDIPNESRIIIAYDSVSSGTAYVLRSTPDLSAWTDVLGNFAVAFAQQSAAYLPAFERIVMVGWEGYDPDDYGIFLADDPFTTPYAPDGNALIDDFWSTTTYAYPVSDLGVNSGPAFVFKNTGTAQRVYVNKEGIKKYIQALSGDLFYFSIYLKKLTGFTGTIKISVFSYDYNYVYLGEDYTTVDVSGFGTFINVSGTLTISDADTSYIDIGISVSASAGADLIIDNFYFGKIATNYILQINAGGRMLVIGDDTDPGKITFDGTLYRTHIGTSTAGDLLSIGPSDDDEIALRVSDWLSNGYYFSAIELTSNNEVVLKAKDPTDTNDLRSASVEMLSDATDQDLSLKLHDGTDLQAINFKFSSTALYLAPSTHKEIDLGQESYAFAEAYADNWNNVADFYFLDHRFDEHGNQVPVNDIEVIKSIKPSTRIDNRVGMTLINDTTIERWLAVKAKAPIETKAPMDYVASESDRWHWVQPGDRVGFLPAGSVLVDPCGKPYLSNKVMTSLLMGAIRKLDERIMDIERTAGKRTTTGING